MLRKFSLCKSTNYSESKKNLQNSSYLTILTSKFKTGETFAHHMQLTFKRIIVLRYLLPLLICRLLYISAFLQKRSVLNA